jgi:hypothetical protein
LKQQQKEAKEKTYEPSWNNTILYINFIDHF